MGAVTLPRPDLAAHRRAVQASFAEIVAELVQILGKKLTAYIGGVKDTRVIERWMQGGTAPYRDVDPRIRLAYQIAKTLSEHDSARVSFQAWFTGLNHPRLQDRAPIRLLKEEEVRESRTRVVECHACLFWLADNRKQNTCQAFTGLFGVRIRGNIQGLSRERTRTARLAIDSMIRTESTEFFILPLPGLAASLRHSPDIARTWRYMPELKEIEREDDFAYRPAWCRTNGLRIA